MRQILRKTMTKLSVNINKVATLRNARGGDIPNVVKVALDCEAFGADGITVHPRPDERHIRRADVYDLRPLLQDLVPLNYHSTNQGFILMYVFSSCPSVAT